MTKLWPSATNKYFCCGSLEIASLYVVPQDPFRDATPPHPRAGVFGDTMMFCSHVYAGRRTDHVEPTASLLLASEPSLTRREQQSCS
jgi:hypothetical protein